MGIDQLRFSRRCRPGERLSLEARLREKSEDSVTWDCRALDEEGTIIMEVTGLSGKWLAR